MEFAVQWLLIATLNMNPRVRHTPGVYPTYDLCISAAERMQKRWTSYTWDCIQQQDGLEMDPAWSHKPN